MYRAARLWLAAPGAIAAGALFGLSAMLDWQDWYHLNIALGTLFLPMTLEAAVRLRRRPGRRQAIILGLVLGASVLVNQESAVLAAILAALILLPWLLGLGTARRQRNRAAVPAPSRPGRAGQARPRLRARPRRLGPGRAPAPRRPRLLRAAQAHPGPASSPAPASPSAGPGSRSPRSPRWWPPCSPAPS